MLDASAMIAYLRGETGADEVESRLEDESEPCMVHAINLCEVYYKAVKRSGVDAAESAVRDLRDQGLVVREDLDEAFWRSVASYKASMNHLPLADCFVVALANRLDADALTADHPDFDPIAEHELCRVTFIR
ncbi:MAG: PIN domain-containing protein [Rubrobacteraceae bacterium]|nr:PIN domain-containing protein [Rubrobacteraceae bacterium]MDQ3436699.1 PIN domain-containing protein [Actinomycetota bacterium]